MTPLESHALEALAACRVPKGASLLAGISGGPDSTALLRFLVSARGDWGFTLHALIVDHGIRSSQQIEQDVDFARSLCGAGAVPLTTARIPAGHCRQRAREESRSLEEVAREERHRLLREAADSLGARWIVLGHTQDDNLETLLMRFIQGSDVAALAGIPRVRGRIIRPLLGCTREEVIDYLRSIRQDWREDASNADLSMLRNRVRHVLLPLLRKEFPGFRSGILGFSRKAALAGDLLREEWRAMGWTATPAGFSIPREAFLAAPAAVRAAALMTLYDALKGSSSPRRLPWRFIAPALGRTLPAARGSIIRGHGVRLVSRDGLLAWERHIVMPCKKSYFKEVSETAGFSVPEAGVHVSFARQRGKNSPPAGETALLARDIEPPLVFRSRRKGDEILLEHGATPLKELFAGWKVSEGHRQMVPILADRKGIVAILGKAFGYADRARAGALIPGDGNEDRIVVRMSREHGRGT